MHPARLLPIGVAFMLVGVILPGLMVLKILPSTWFLNFFSFGAQVAGLFMGVIGAAYRHGSRRR